MARVSFVVTTYNVEAYVATALQSAVDCGFETCEVILVDDGSTDATCRLAEMVMAAAPSDVIFKPVYFAQNSIGGVACAANAGLEQATGEVVVFIDGDDWVIPSSLRGAVAKLLEAPADFVVCGCKEYWNNNGEYTRYPEAHFWQKALRSGDHRQRQDLVLQMAPFPWRKIYRRSFLEQQNIRFPVGNYFFEDNPFHWETTLKSTRFRLYEPVTHVHRMMRQGQTVTDMGIKPLQIFSHAQTIAAMLQDSGKWEAWQQSYFRWLISHILWCARHVSPAGLNLLFEKAREALARFPDDVFSEFLSQRNVSMEEMRQLSALQLGDRIAFLRSIECRETAS